MSSVVVAGNTSGSVTLDAPAVSGSTVITLPTASGTMVATDTSGNVGIGTTSSLDKLTVAGALKSTALLTGSSITASSTYIDNASGTARMLSYGPDSSTRGSFNFFQATSANTSGQLAVNINANANIALSGASTTATGVGITFPATQSASTDVNCLDDYEEGTWTPVFTPTSGAIGSYNAQSGTFTKVGRAVTVTCYLAVNSKGTAGGTLSMTGLPFANNSGSGAYTSCSMYMNIFTSGPTGNFVSYLSPGSTFVSLAYLAGQTTTTAITSAMISNGTDFMISMTYMTA